MPKEVYYFRHDANAHGDLKIKSLRKKYGWEGYGWWWYLIELLRSEDNYKLYYCDNTFEGMSEDLKCEAEKVREFIDYCIGKNLIVEEEGYIYAPRLSRDMEVYRDLSEKGRQAAFKRWGKDSDKEDAESVPNTNPMPTHTEPNTIKRKERKGNNIKGENNISLSNNLDGNEALINDRWSVETCIEIAEGRRSATERNVELAQYELKKRGIKFKPPKGKPP